MSDSNYIRKYFVGSGIDIGGKPDPLALYTELFPLMDSVRVWDWEDGDAQFMAGVDDQSFDFVFASHCLEHLVDPREGLRNWMRIVKPGGHLIINVPDEDMYEQGIFPSTFNRDHKWTFTIFKSRSWSDRSINLAELVAGLGEAADVRKLEMIDAAYRHQLPRFDQTLSPVAEAAIELVIRRRPAEEIAAGGRLPTGKQPDPSLRLHFNQYRADQATLRAANGDAPPFTNDGELKA
ncbi:MAG TPA: methyltransferase domain-containing protein [Allosphingosinicella sp.]|uniref:methyltransferase domain-containing protein n=1 Tax=Allosphingosinicella sp. TaxID=2823234 RepID=UPI002F27EDC3